MLRLEHRRMQSEHLRLNDLKRLQSWKEKLFERNLIVAYDYEKGFMYVTRNVQDGESLFRLDPPSLDSPMRIELGSGRRSVRDKSQLMPFALKS